MRRPRLNHPNAAKPAIALHLRVDGQRRGLADLDRSARDHVKDKRMRVASAFVGETNLNVEMVRNGWAISDHEGMDPWEIVARENKRGLWRGQFIVPARWRKGERLAGE